MYRWAQKLLSLYTTVSHHQSACRRSFHRKQHGSSTVSLLHYPLTLDQPGDSDSPDHVWAGLHRNRSVPVDEIIADLEEDGETHWRLQCLPDLTGLLFMDTWGRPTEHEMNIHDIAMAAMTHWISTQPSHPSRLPIIPLLPHSVPIGSSFPGPFSSIHHIYADQLSRTSPLSCFDQLTLSPSYSTADNQLDMDEWRLAAHTHFHFSPEPPHSFTEVHIPSLNHSTVSSIAPALSAMSQSSCPPGRAVLLHTIDHVIINKDEVLRRLYKKFHLKVEVVNVDHHNLSSSYELAKLFASTGLILSGHIDVLTNVLFSARNAAIVEMGGFHGMEFARLTRSLGLFYRMAIGGERMGREARVQGCRDGLRECGDGDGFCVERVARARCDSTEMGREVRVDVDVVEHRVQAALGHLYRSCGFEHWKPGVLLGKFVD